MSKMFQQIELTVQLVGPMLAELKASFNEELAKRKSQSAAELVAAQVQGKEVAKAEISAEQAALKELIKAQDKKLREAQAVQTAALKREQELKDKEAEMELTLQKMLADERPALGEKLDREADEKAGLKLAEQAQVRDGMRRQSKALKQKSEQGSMQTQGEAAEIVLEETLTAAFPMDGFVPVAKGVSGADMRQDVKGLNGIAGSILWESKRTKNWSAGWLAKLRDDQRPSGCEVAVITSHALPEGIDSFSMVDGIWVSAPRYAVPLASSLREALINVASAKDRVMGQETKMEMIYDYLTGTQFKQCVDAIVERF